MQRISSSLITKKQELLKNQTPSLGNQTEIYNMVIVRKGEVPIHVMKACKGNRGITPLIHDLGAGWRRVAMSSLSHFLSRNQLRYPVTRRLAGGGLHSMFWIKEIFIFPTGIRTPDHIARTPVSIDCAPKARLTQHPTTLFGAPETLGPHAAAYSGH